MIRSYKNKFCIIRMTFSKIKVIFLPHSVQIAIFANRGIKLYEKKIYILLSTYLLTDIWVGNHDGPIKKKKSRPFEYQCTIVYNIHIILFIHRCLSFGGV